MALTYFTDGPWGTGKGSRLTAAEQDANHWSHEQRLAALEDADPSSVVISNITVLGNQMMVYLSDGTQFGPFTLPTAMFQFRGEFAAGAPYQKFDLFSVRQQGLFLVQQPFTGPALPFDPGAVDGNGDPYYVKVFGEETYVYDVGFSFPGKPGQGITDGENFMEHLFVRDVSIPADFLKSKAQLGQAPASLLEFPICKNDVAIGTLAFAAGSRVGTFEWDVTGAKEFEATDVLGIRRPTTIDAQARRLVVTIAAQVL